MVRQLWQEKEAKALRLTSKKLAELALNPCTSDESFFRTAIYETVNIRKRRRARKRRAVLAGQKGAKGVEVITKDTVDPHTAKQLGAYRLGQVLKQCKKHKWLVDSAFSKLDQTPTKWSQQELKRWASGEPRDEFPDADFPRTLKNYAAKSTVDGWAYMHKKLERLLEKVEPRINTDHPMADRPQGGDLSAIREKKNDPLAYFMGTRERLAFRRQHEKLQALVREAPRRIDSKIDKHVKAQLDRAQAPRPYPVDHDFPVT